MPRLGAWGACRQCQNPEFIGISRCKTLGEGAALDVRRARRQYENKLRTVAQLDLHNLCFAQLAQAVQLAPDRYTHLSVTIAYM